MRSSLFFVAFACATTAHAQYAYVDGTTVTADSITFYVHRLVSACISLSNVRNTLSRQQQQTLQGEPVLPWDIEMGELDFDAFKRAFTETFTEEEAVDMRDRKARIRLFLTKDGNGALLEVAFTFYALPGMPIFPPSKYASYEKNLKKYVRWKTITDDERKLKFTHESMLLDLRSLVPYKVAGGVGVGLFDNLGIFT